MLIFDWLPEIGLAFFAGMLICIEAGFRIGLRKAAKAPEESDGGTGAIEAAVFALFGLLLAFSFSGATGRLDTRRAMIVNEANAIGTAYLRIDMLPDADQPAMRDLFRSYLDSRIAVFGSSATLEEVLRELDRGAELQSRIWSGALASIKSDPSLLPARVQIIPALNEMIDITTTRKIAMFTHIPVLVFALLVGISLISALIAGYAMSKRRKGTRSVFHMLMYAIVVSITLYVVLDIEYPRAGLVRLDEADRALIELRESMH